MISLEEMYEFHFTEFIGSVKICFKNLSIDVILCNVLNYKSKHLKFWIILIINQII